MKKQRYVVAILWLFLSLVWQLPAMAAVTAAAKPVDFRTCNFRQGKDELDLAPLLVKFRNYAKQKDVGYAAWILKPELHSTAEFDFGWLGSWPDGVAYGTSMERWKKDGKPLAREFNSVVDCSARHELAMSLPINAPDGTPEDGVLLFYACDLNEGTTVQEAYKAHLEFGQAMKAKGSLSVSWMYTPAAGAGAQAPDYYHVVGFFRYSDLGDTMELFVNRGGVELRRKIIGPVASCLTPNIYDAMSVRAPDETR